MATSIFVPSPSGISHDVRHRITTPGTYSWTCPAGVTEIEVTLWAGGESGNHDGSVLANIRGGDNGQILSAIIDVTPSTSYTLIVGAGGAAASGSGHNIGGNTDISSYLRAFGGGQTLDKNVLGNKTNVKILGIDERERQANGTYTGAYSFYGSGGIGHNGAGGYGSGGGASYSDGGEADADGGRGGPGSDGAILLEYKLRVGETDNAPA